MAATRASKLISLTILSSGAPFYISLNKIVKMFLSGTTDTLLTYVENGQVKDVIVNEAPTVIQAASASGTIEMLQDLVLSTGQTIYINNDRIIKVDAVTGGSMITYDMGLSAPENIQVTATPATISTDSGNLIPITTVATSSIPSHTLYINNLNIDKVAVQGAGEAADLSFTTKAIVGTGIVSVIGSGYTSPTVSITGGGGSGAAGTLTTKVLTATVVSGGTGGTPGAVTLTGTTGTGTKVQCTGTINGSGVLTGALVVTVAGNYTVPITNIAIEPCTATASLTGATISVSLGLLAFTVSSTGTGYTSYPTIAVVDATGTLGAITASFAVESPLVIVDGGSGYDTAPTLTFSATTGTLATATATITSPPGTITATSLTNAGAYKSGTDAYPTLAISGGSGSKIIYDEKRSAYKSLYATETPAAIAILVNAL